ncbi:TrbI/VirB10 family protein [Methylocystis parvus]|uniref:TrbI/VirB10 family protein n=1 Tax=Methylocystis parvus TaxID=134 RepID=A0A6B8MB50_9HYPH|nr:TrbI/VirB10 family protein [Methylocystis parvus]QGM99868.1 TrbI/VirB10 family protein [Methylocystis parvus]WBK02290.1 TrbI/VirB10 family protein [Methylocystis parvus OBBP]
MSAPGQEKKVAEELRLRPERPQVTRLSRRALIALAGVSSASVLGLTLWALHENSRTGPPPELYNTGAKTTADGFDGLPRDYAGLPRNVPKLGPPLPGDLGRPILAAQGQYPQSTVDPEEQRAGQEREAARTAKLFAPTSVRERPSTATAAPPSLKDEANAQSSISLADSAPIDPGAIQNMQDRKLAFVNAPVDRRTVSSDRLAAPASRYVLQAGAVIPAALVTGIRSDLPGQITAQVTENVYDSPTGKFLLIPQGSRLIGVYDSQIAFGQSRVLLVWSRLILPDGHSIVLERQSGADSAGYSGLEDEVDHHWLRLAGAAALSTILGVGTQLGTTGDENALIQALRRGGAQSLNQTGQQIVGRNLNIQPTLTIRPGFPVRVILTRDLVLAQYPEVAEVAATGVDP